MQWRSYKIDVTYQIKFFHVPLARFSTNFCIRFFAQSQFNKNTNINSIQIQIKSIHLFQRCISTIDKSEFDMKFLWVNLKWQALSPVVPMSWINEIAICPLPGFKKKRPTTTPGNDTLHRATGLPGHNYTILFSPSLFFFLFFFYCCPIDTKLHQYLYLYTRNQ